MDAPIGPAEHATSSEAQAPHNGSQSDTRPLIRTVGIAAALAAYIGGAVYAYWPASMLSSTRLVGGGIGDSAGQVNALAWTPFALSHLMNLYETNWLNFPVGVNLAANASAPALGLLAWPITATLGAVAAANFIFLLAFAASAASMFFVLFRITNQVSAAFLGGLLYGFSPYMVGEGLGHMAILFVPIPPLVFLLVRELMVSTQRSPRHTGIALGIALGVQAYISVELIATMAMLALIGLILVCIARLREIASRLRSVVTAALWTVVVFAVVAAYPIWYQLIGPLHLSGPPQPLLTLDSYRTDLLGPIVPTVLQRFAPSHLAAIGSSYATGNISENGIYLGLPLVLGSIVLLVLCWRNLTVRICLLLAAVAYVFSLGPTLVVNNYHTGVKLPFDILLHLPLVSGEVPGRYSLFVDLFVATALAVGVADLTDRVTIHLRFRNAGSSSKWRARVALAAPTIVAAGLLIPLVPVLPIATSVVAAPAFFTSTTLKRIPNGSVMLAYPYPEPGAFDQAMLWQALANNRFKIIGGYAIFRGIDGAGIPYPAVLSPTVVQNLFDEAYFGASAPPGAAPLGPLILSSRTARLLQIFLSRYHVETVVMQPGGDDPALALRYLEAALGPPVPSAGLYLWFDVPHLLRQRVLK